MLEKYTKEFSEKWAEATAGLPKTKVENGREYRLMPDIAIKTLNNGDKILSAVPVYKEIFKFEEDM